jgi:ribokinase
MKLDVIGFGALNLDKLYRVNKIAREDEESFITDLKESAGGSAANTIVGLARLGLKTGFIGKVGADREGELLLQDFRNEGVDARGVVVSTSGRSGVVTGYVDARGERALYVDPGANDDLLELRNIDLEYATRAEFLHLTSFVGRKPFQAQKNLVRTLSDVKVSFDPGALYARKSLESLKPILSRSFVTFPSTNEMRLLTGEDYETGARTLTKEGVNIVAVKLGDKGCYVTDGAESHLIEPYKVKVVDTTGAGDAFCAGFLYGLTKNRDLYECGRLGNFVASMCIRRRGARVGLPRLAELREMESASESLRHVFDH